MRFERDRIGLLLSRPVSSCRWLRRGFCSGVGVLVVFLAVTGLAVGAIAGNAAQSNAGSVAGEAGRLASGKPALRVAVGFAPLSLNPALGVTDGGTFAFAYEPLIRERPNGSLAPALATSWRYFKTSAGPNKGFELTLRRNARFSDGSLVTARAVKGWLDYFPTAKGPQANQLDIGSVEAVGQWTVRIRLRTPNPNVPLQLSSYATWGLVVGPKAVADPSLLATGSLGAGPYMLDPSQTVSGDHYTYIPNPYYYDKSQIKWSKVLVKVITSPTSLLQALKAGQFDLGVGDQSTAGEAQSSGLRVVSDFGWTNALVIADRSGTIAKPLADVRVRQALSYAIDRKTMCNAIYGKYGAPTSLPEVTIDGTDPKFLNYYSYNQAKAKALLASAGYPQGFTLSIGGGFPGFPPTIVEQPVVQYLSAVGVKVDLEQAVNAGDFTKKLFSAGYPAYFIQSPKDTAAGRVKAFYLPNSALNPFHVSDPVLNKLYYTAIRAAKAPAVWKQLYGRVVTQAYSLGLCRYSTFWYAGKKIKGLRLVSAGRVPDITELSPQT